jgi:GT2 family glycosyltransferase
VGIVVIGRNEGERLRRCLDSLGGGHHPLVYVDSGSSDGSVALARSSGAEVIELGADRPFTAARARNAGFHRLTELHPELELVQFVDGDCEVEAGWIPTAVSSMLARPDAAVVCGRRRERFPERSIYNRLADMEWNTPVGEALTCGGDALMRTDAFRHAGGFDAAMIAGEEPELCVRLRQVGGRVLRIDADMTIHDAGMTRFAQWWKRSYRGGYAYALGAAMHGRSPARHWVRESASIWFWGAALPLASVGLAWPTGGASLALLVAVPIWWARVAAQRRRRSGDSLRAAATYAAFCMLGKLPQALGLGACLWHRWRGRSARLVEYK